MLVGIWRWAGQPTVPCYLRTVSLRRATFLFHFQGISKGGDKLAGWNSGGGHRTARGSGVEECGLGAGCVEGRGTLMRFTGSHRGVGTMKGCERAEQVPATFDREQSVPSRGGNQSWARRGPWKVTDPEYRGLYPKRHLLPGLMAELRAGELSLGSNLRS